jgi:hypothetical protein
MDLALDRTGLDVPPEENVVAARALARLAPYRALGAMTKDGRELSSALRLETRPISPISFRIWATKNVSSV